MAGIEIMTTQVNPEVLMPELGRRLIAGHQVRWNAELAEAAYDAGLWVSDTIGVTLGTLAQSDPKRVLLVDGDVRLTAEDLYDQARRLACAMLAKAGSGSVVSFMLPNWHEAAIIYSAATLAGMIVNPILPSLRDQDLLFILNDTESKLLFVPEDFYGFHYGDMIERIYPQLEYQPEVGVVRGAIDGLASFESFLKAGRDAVLPKVHADAVRMILYTSGTTGTPKGVMHSHNSIHALIKQLEEHWLIDAGDKFLVPSPISHIGGSIYAFECPILLGTTAILMDHWDAGRALEIMNDEACTHIAAATPFLQKMLEIAQRDSVKFNTLKLFVCGGASVPPSLIKAASAYFSNTIFTRVYGSTEVPVTTVGVLQSGDIKHASETDGVSGIANIKLVGPTDSAEIRVRGPQMLVGYLHSADEATVFDEEGYYRTGDLGCWVDDRYLVISGRAKDIIIRNGENISPKEIEDILVKHPDVSDVAIVGVPDKRTGERACAVVVLSTDPGPSLSDLVDFLEDCGVAKFKLPEQMVIQKTLPKNEAGKVLKHQIQAQLIRQFTNTEQAMYD